MDLHELSKKWHEITINIENDIDEALTDMEPYFVKANQNALLEGELSTGEKMNRLMNPYYVDYKIDDIGSKAAQKTPPLPDLKDTGAFHRGMTSDVEGDSIVITSKDSKTSKLTQKYSLDIFGIQNKELPNLQNIFSKNFNQLIYAKLL